MYGILILSIHPHYLCFDVVDFKTFSLPLMLIFLFCLASVGADGREPQELKQSLDLRAGSIV